MSASADLTGLLNLAARPIAISWVPAVPDDVPAFDAPMPEPTPDGRTGRAPAACVFWMHATDRTFSTVEADHGNCSVGLLTHGWRALEEVASNEDVAALLESGWVTAEAVPEIPTVSEKPGAMVYGPLAEGADPPDVVLIRVNGEQLMMLSDAVPDLRLEGKPQCHILAIAKEQGQVAASIGCAVSRVRTGMGSDEMTCAIPGSRLDEVVEALRKTSEIYAALLEFGTEDAARFEAS